MTVEFFRNSILQEFRSEKQLSVPKYCNFDDQLKKAKLATFPSDTNILLRVPIALKKPADFA